MAALNAIDMLVLEEGVELWAGVEPLQVIENVIRSIRTFLWFGKKLGTKKFDTY